MDKLIENEKAAQVEIKNLYVLFLAIEESEKIRKSG